jgi:hypothetical protein
MRKAMSPQRRIKITRDMVLFTAGLLGIANETLLHEGERPTLLLLFAAMVGLPAFLQRDESRKEDDTVKSREASDREDT